MKELLKNPMFGILLSLAAFEAGLLLQKKTKLIFLNPLLTAIMMVIAVLMLQGRLPLDRAAADGFAQVDWTDLNERCKRDYAAAVRAVVDERSLDAVRVEAAARKAFDALGALDIVVKQGSARPPKSPKA